MSSDTQVVDEDTMFLFEDAVIDHMGVPADSMKMYREGITLEFLDAEFHQKQRKVLGDEKHAYRVMQWVYSFIGEHGVAPSLEVVKEQFQQLPFVEPTQPVAYTIRRLRERKAHADLMVVQKQIARHSGEDVLQAVNWGFAKFSEMARMVIPRTTSVNPAEDYINERDEYMQAKALGKIMGYTFGFGSDMDEALGGIRGFTVNMGRPKQMKSWISLHSAMMAAYGGAHVVYYTLEMQIKASQGMQERLGCMVSDFMARETGIDPGKHSGKIPGTSFNDRGKGRWDQTDFDNYDRLWDEWNANCKGSIRLERPGMMQRSTSHLRDFSAGADVVYIDQFEYIDPPANTPTGLKQWEQIKYTCDALVEWSDAAAILVNHQFNRDATKEKDEETKVRTMGQVEHIAGGDTIGKHAHLIVGSLRTKEMKTNSVVAFGDVAARSAEGGEWWIGYDLTKGCRLTYEGSKSE